MRLRSGHRVLAEPPTSPARSAAKSNDGFYTRRKHTRSITDYNMEELNEMSIDEIAEAMPKWADYHMTPLQEVANSVSMVIPAGVIFYYWLNPPHDTFWNEYTGALAYGTLLHLPFSFFYHLLCAFRVFKDPVDCIPRKLDQTFIHVNCVIFAYGLSGSYILLIATAIINTWHIIRLWLRGKHDNAFERRSNILMDVVVYTMPMAYRGDYHNWAIALFGCWGSAAFVFAFNDMFGGWGHQLSHVIMALFLGLLLHSADGVAPWCDEHPGRCGW